MDEEKYKGWLVSNSLLKRSMAVTGHNLLGTLIIYGAVFIVLFIIGLFFGFIGALIS